MRPTRRNQSGYELPARGRDARQADQFRGRRPATRGLVEIAIGVVGYARAAGIDAHTLQCMTALQAAIVVCGSLLLLTAMCAAMLRATESQRRSMQRRREAWIAGGSIPEEEPNFYACSVGG